MLDLFNYLLKTILVLKDQIEFLEGTLQFVQIKRRYLDMYDMWPIRLWKI
jgi:hypothetical protein